MTHETLSWPPTFVLMFQCVCARREMGMQCVVHMVFEGV